MPPLPRFTASISPPRESGYVRAPLMSGTEGEASARALVGLGQAIQNTAGLGAKIIDRKLEAEANLQFSQATQKIKDFVQSQADDFEKKNITTDEQQKSLIQDYATDLDTFANEQLAEISPRAREKFNLWRADALPEYAREMGRIGAKKWNDYQIGEWDKLINDAVNNGDIDTAKQLVDGMDAIELISHKEAVRLKNRIEIQGEKAQQDIIQEIYFQKAMTLPVEQRISYANNIPANEITNENRNHLKARINEETGVASESEKAEIDKMFILPQDEFLENVSVIKDKINNSLILTTKEKEEQRKKIDDRVNAIAEGKIDPVNEFDPDAYNQLALKITRDSKTVKISDIGNKVGLGSIGGITTKQAEDLYALKKKYDSGDIIGNRLHERYTGAIASLRTAKAFSADKNENIAFAAKAQSLLDQWAINHPEATEEEYEAFIDELLDMTDYKTWNPLKGGFWYQLFTRKRKEQQRYTRENIELMKGKTGGGEDLSKLSDAELLKKITGGK